MHGRLLEKPLYSFTFVRYGESRNGETAAYPTNLIIWRTWVGSL